MSFFVWSRSRTVINSDLSNTLDPKAALAELRETPGDSAVTLSGLYMRPTASEYVPKDITVPKVEQTDEIQTFVTTESGLVDEDVGLTVMAENRLLAATAFEQMGIDPRVIRAL